MFTFVVSEAFVATGGDEDFELLNSLLKTCAVLMRSSRGSALSRHFYHLQPDPVVHCGKSSVGKYDGIRLVVQSVLPICQDVYCSLSRSLRYVFSGRVC